MTTATHSLDTASGSTTVAELLARNGAPAGLPPHRRSAPEPAGHGSLNGTLPAFAPVEPDAPKQYRYDQTTVTALLAAQPAEPKNTATASKHTGRKLAGLAFAGAVLVGGWALASAQAQPAGGPANAEPVPAKTPDAPLVAANAPTLQTIGVQSAALVGPATPSAPAAGPQTADRAPDRGTFSGTLPTTTQAKAPAATPPAAPKPRQAQVRPAPTLPSYSYDFAKYGNGKNTRGGSDHHDNDHHGNGGKHGKGH